ncbi:hypothetical protein PF005_g22845 [Phytophthora fragariae]|uniref:Uncharacterized protein n=1 Tax=Phytophthora fragariae TaxID=53985 RepID=A0A6A3WEV8_9STRA|nr:hypothetical protein PF011_g24500 [Phytophthora fragariae]KAE9070414.1 hypothetical protein PF010_g26287 [Phytophthora fragariae]KAE9089418.1 hypothetical protein PF006_g25366 [Phytophthora fragariae]KAE9181546.1 hypothetical protein PF005_g22845 [Phytophthora fragariae]KAE9207784.1 hypothetical protein PF002_g19612 [Phytophthora fragariae]
MKRVLLSKVTVASCAVSTLVVVSLSFCSNSSLCRISTAKPFVVRHIALIYAIPKAVVAAVNRPCHTFNYALIMVYPVDINETLDPNVPILVWNIGMW